MTGEQRFATRGLRPVNDGERLGNVSGSAIGAL